ncbi:ATP-binding protein [Methylobacterium sp. P31]
MARDVKLNDRYLDAAIWTERFQPETFDEVIANDSVREYLGHRVRSRDERRTGSNRHRAIILHGPFGCGKTTLAHIFANAMNCARPQEDGSPCRTCPFCCSFNPFGSTVCRYHHCAEQGGGLEDVRGILQEAEGHPGENRIRVVTLDEAHALSPAAQDALLKRLERPPAATVFVLLTTRLDKLTATVRSRCDTLGVQEIAREEATDYARAICKHVGVDCEDEALALIVHKADGHLRDLVRDLEFVAEGGAVTVARTRRVLGLDYLDYMLDYLDCVVRCTALETQVAAIDAWRAPATMKAAQLQDFLLYLYFTEVHHLRRPHPLFGAIEPERRAGLVSDFGMKAAAGLAVTDFWESLIALWRAPIGGWSEAEFGLRLSQFDRFLHWEPDERATERRGRDWKRSGSDEFAARRTRRVPPQNPDTGEDNEGGPWLTLNWAKRFWNAGSFLVQEYGVLLNMRVTFDHGLRDVLAHQTAAEHVGRFMHALTTMLHGTATGGGRHAADEFHWMYVHEADKGGALRTHVVAHMPPATWPRVRKWFQNRTHEDKRSPVGRAATRLHLLDLHRDGKAFELHVNYLRLLCRGLSRSVTDKGAAVVDLLGVPKHCQDQIGRVLCTQRGRVSKSIGEGTQQHCKEAGLAMLSAFERHAWAEVASGWELKEHAERQRTKAEFVQEEAIALGALDGHPEPLREKMRAQVLRALFDKRQKAAHLRQRDECGWWSSGVGRSSDGS